LKCPKCNSTIDLSVEDVYGNCPHCAFYYYIQNALRIMCIACIDIEINENKYFKNLHQRLYNPFIEQNEGKLDPISGAISIGEYLISNFKFLIQRYPKEDLLFAMMALRELATWKIILSPHDTWASTQIRNIAHVFTNLVSAVEEGFGDNGIVDTTDFIFLFVLSEEIERLVSNVFDTKTFSWSPTLSEILKLRLANEHLSWFHEFFEVEELQKPEEITFSNKEILSFLRNRGLEVSSIKNSVSSEIENLFGFSFQDLKNFKDDVISIARESGQVLNIFPINDNRFLECVFVFKEQLKGIHSEKVTSIMRYMTYRPTFKAGDTYDNLYNPHMDYKFIFEYEDLIAFGVLDSSNSITMFENIASSDHFIEDIFGIKATMPFKKAQQDISYLISMKIAEHFSNKEGFFVPMQQKGVPNVNIKLISGNGIKKRIVNDLNQDLGDIDAVIVDLVNKKISLIEVKYYKPSINNREMIKKDKKIFEDIKKILAREEWFKKNLSEIIKAWGLEMGDYTIETILVTGRPNYFGKQIEEEYKNIKYHTYDSILRM
jgi:hypothetical protein